MATPFDPRVNDNPSTYFVQDRKNKKELTRLTIQDRMFTTGMGGVLSEQPDPTIFHRVLDIGCGPGGWIMEAAKTYPTMSLVGIDISQRMMEYARAQAKAHRIHDRVEFHVMDALGVLGFPDTSFDLVNLRGGVSYLRTWDWPKFLTELLRVTRPGGVVRVTDAEILHQSTSPALRQLFEMAQCAFFRSGHFFTDESTGIVDHLARLLDQYGCDQVQTKAYALEYQAGTKEGEIFYEDMMLMFQTLRQYFQKWSCASKVKDYETICQEALDEMRQPDFHATWNLLTAWGSKPKSAHIFSLDK
jgi:ubiquinone/menaquinone biosynthesis C-methylase UbiE